ncbi:MAG: 1-acyl-sn-glycerol-3-phosphate acyltransferase [Candidatus Syntrophosphaera sp.]|nr:1-acyl-sn-glycerol-3-phosphate acyltransferase [Candidatus Syntrophosphaera sp.]
MLKLLTTILWKAWYVLFMLLTFLALPFLLIFKPFVSPGKYRHLAWLVASTWARVTVRSTGSRVRINGRELIPNATRLVFIGNHQSLFDIPCFLGWIGRPVGFVAKQELFRIPALSQWMHQLPCVFIDRNSARQAMATFKASAEIIRQGHPLVIFPEGGRSDPEVLRKFHLGSLKLPQMADATIIPFAIKSSWRIMEIDNHIHAAQVTITILPPVRPDDPLYNQKIELAEHLQSMIGTALNE